MDVFNPIKKTPTPGCEKIEIKELDKDSKMQVTFSKRRAGLFKKASEHCVICNTQLAIVVFSPGDKPFCFGQPNAEAVLCHYLGESSEYETSPAVENNSFSYREMNTKYEEATRVLELERKRLEEIENLTRVWDQGNWWDQPFDDIDLVQLEQYAIAMYELRRKVAERADEFEVQVSSAALWVKPSRCCLCSQFYWFSQPVWW